MMRHLAVPVDITFFNEQSPRSFCSEAHIASDNRQSGVACTKMFIAALPPEILEHIFLQDPDDLAICHMVDKRYVLSSDMTS